MEDISREKEEEEDRPLEEKRKPERKKRERVETLPTMSYQDYEKEIQKDMDNIFNPEFLSQDRKKFDHRKKEVKGIRRFLLDKILLRGIPAKFNSSTSSSDVFQNTTLEKDRKKPNNPIIYVKYKGNRTAFSYNSRGDAIGERLRITDEKVYKELQDDLEREISEFKGDTFAGQVTTQFEQQQEAMDLSFIDKTIERPEPENFTPQAFRPTFRDIDDAQKEITEKMRMEFEDQKYNLESNLRQEENRRRRAEDNLEETIKMHRKNIKELATEIEEKENRIKVLEDQLKTQSFSQFDRNSTNREIQELKAEVSRLKREKDDLEKQLQAQKQRTKLVEEDRDKWREYSKSDEASLAASKASLAASEEKVLSLEKEKDDLDDTIKNLKKVNSILTDKYRNYQIEVDRKLDKAKAEYIKDKTELESAYQRDISELESIISKLEEKKEKGFSESEINSLKSSLEKKNITIQKLESENFRLRDLNLSFKSIGESDEKIIEEKKKEIKAQKQEFERVKSLLEERLRKKVQKLKEVEVENRKQKEDIESYLSQLEELNKIKSQSVSREVFIANQNEFTKVQKENKDLKRDVLELRKEKEEVEKRKKILEEEIILQQKRIEAKDNENTEFVEKEKKFIRDKEEFNRKEKTFQQNIRDKDENIRQKGVTLERQREELEDLRKKKEKLEDDLDKQKFYKQQYERKIAEYNALVESSDKQINQGVRDKNQLEEELIESQKQLQEYQEKFVDPKLYEEMVRDNKDLIETMKLKDQDILYSTKIINNLHAEKTTIEKKYKKEKENHDKVKQNFENYRRQANQREREIEEWNRDEMRRVNRNHADQVARLEREIKDQKENYEFRLSQALRPGDIKSVKLLLNNLSLDDLDEENYRDAYIKYKTARDNFAKKANDETSSRVQRLMFEELKKLADIRLDLLNMSFNRSAKTEAGKEFIRRTDQTLAGKFYRFRMRVGRYLAGTTLGAGIMGIFYYVYELLKAGMSKVAVPIATRGKILASTLKKAASKIGQAAWNSKPSTKAIVISGTAAYIDKSKKEGYINTLYNWLYNLYHGLVYGANLGGKIMETSLNTLGTVVNTAANIAKYTANNTSSVFLMIISAIGIAITIKYSREK